MSGTDVSRPFRPHRTVMGWMLPQAYRPGLTAGQKGGGLAQPGHHLHQLPNRHAGHLFPEGPYLVDLGVELLALARLDPGTGRDPAAAAVVDDVRVFFFLLRHRVDHP